MSYMPSTDKIGSYYYYCIITNTNNSLSGVKSAKRSSGYAKVEVKKYANKISGVSSTWEKNTESSAFTLPAKANGKITFKSSNTKVATVSSTGKVTVKGIGTATITITAGDSTYETVTKQITVRVVPSTAKLTYVASKAKKSLSVKWDKMSGVSGFKIQYSTSKNFTNAKTSYISGSRHSKSRADLSAGKKYYVRICAYKKIGNTTYEGKWSNVKSYTVKSK
jgi:hypothetical protein